MRLHVTRAVCSRNLLISLYFRMENNYTYGERYKKFGYARRLSQVASCESMLTSCIVYELSSFFLILPTGLYIRIRRGNVNIAVSCAVFIQN
jgi:hypothetical protein